VGDIVLGLGDDVGGDADDVVVVVDLAGVRCESEVVGRRQSNIVQCKAGSPLVPGVRLQLHLFLVHM
jgi:hypothetical protein